MVFLEVQHYFYQLKPHSKLKSLILSFTPRRFNSSLFLFTILLAISKVFSSKGLTF
jgi:hypothetical protein